MSAQPPSLASHEEQDHEKAKGPETDPGPASEDLSAGGMTAQEETGVAPTATGSDGVAGTKTPGTEGGFEERVVDVPPMAVHRPPPRYPLVARRRNLTGVVRIRFLVDETGHVKTVRIVESTPPGVFDKAVRDAVPGWRFRPGVFKGKTVPVWCETSVVFRLE